MSGRRVTIGLAALVVLIVVGAVALRHDVPSPADGKGRAGTASRASRQASDEAGRHEGASTHALAGRVLAGRVTLRGEPVAGAHVWFRRLHRLDPATGRVLPTSGSVVDSAEARVRTNADGRFGVATLPDDLYAIVARDAAGRVGRRYGVDVRRGRTAVTEIELSDAAYPLRIRVVDRGEAARGSLVVRSLAQPLDAEGRATVYGREAGNLLVRFVDEARSLTGARVVRVPADGEYVWDLAGERRPVAGRVIDAATEKPIAGARVRVTGGADWGARRSVGARYETRTCDADAEGRFAVDALTPLGRIEASAEGYDRGTAGVVRDPKKVVVRLEPLASIRGRVVDADGGATLPGVVVVAVRPTDFTPDGDPRATTTGADGSFALEGVPPGRRVVVVAGGGYLSPGIPENDPSLEVEVPRQGLAGLELVARRAAIVTGRVIDADDEPVVGAVARLFQRAPSWTRSALETRVSTDGAGGFRFDGIIPGVESRVYCRGGTATGTFRPGENDPIEIRLEPASVVEVLVVDAETGAPVEGASFRVDQESSESRPWRDARTDASGRATLVCDGSPVRSVRASAAGHRDSEPLPPTATDEPLRIELAPGARIEGHVFDPSGSPVAGVDVSTNLGGSSFAKTDADGAFDLTLPGPGTYRLGVRGVERVDVTAPASGVVLEAPSSLALRFVDPSGGTVRAGRFVLVTGRSNAAGLIPPSGHAEIRAPFESGSTTVVVSGLPRTEDGAALGAGTYGPLVADRGGEIVVPLDLAAPLRGRVVDASEDPVAGARVAVPLQSGGWSTRCETSTDETGRFEIVELRAGPYRVEVEPGGGRRGTDADAVAGGPDVMIRLGAVATGTVVVRGPRREPVVGARVVARGKREDLKRESGVTGADGSVELVRLDPTAEYEVDVEPPTGSALLGASSRWRPPGRIEIELREGRVVAGVIVDAAGRPVSTAMAVVRWRPPDRSGPWTGRSFRAGKDGRFRGVVPRRPLRVAAQDGRRSPDRESFRDVRLGDDAEGLRLVVERATHLEIVLPPEARGQRITFYDERYSDGGGSLTTSTPGGGAPMVVQLPRSDHVYTIWIAIPGDDHYVLAEGVRADAGRVTVSASRGATLSGRIRVGGRPARGTVIVRRGRLSLQRPTEGDGRFSFRGVPPGDWLVRFSSRGRTAASASTTVATGAPAEIEFDE